jgi:hypothetical protein
LCRMRSRITRRARKSEGKPRGRRLRDRGSGRSRCGAIAHGRGWRRGGSLAASYAVLCRAAQRSLTLWSYRICCNNGESMCTTSGIANKSRSGSGSSSSLQCLSLCLFVDEGCCGLEA